MPTYILLLSLTPEGRHRLLDNPDRILVAEESIDIPQTQVHGLYAVLGEFDFVTILDAPDNESAARFSMELGVTAGVQITTLPAIPIGRLQQALGEREPEMGFAGTPSPGDYVPSDDN
jgi:uncharacterized protein with GYD domain